MIASAPRFVPGSMKPRLAGARLGQISNSVIDRAAKQVVAEADPRVRQIIAEERERLARALAETFTFGGLGVVAALSTRYFAGTGAAQAVGYGAAAILGGVAAWRLWYGLRAPAPPPPPPDTAIAELIAPVVNQMATAIVREAEPRIASIVEAEKTKFSEAAKAALPAAAGSAVAYLGTAYFVPDDMRLGKVAGYSASAGLLFYSIYRMVWGS